MGLRKSVSRWYKMKRIAARVDRERYTKMRSGTYDFSLEGTPKRRSTRDHDAPLVRKLNFASDTSSPHSDDDYIWGNFDYSAECGDPCLWNAARIDQDLEEQEHCTSLISHASTVRSGELEQCLEELPPLKAYRFLGLRDSEPRYAFQTPLSDRPPSLEDLRPLSPLLFDFQDDSYTQSAQPARADFTPAGRSHSNAAVSDNTIEDQEAPEASRAPKNADKN
ncbi:hypothetical protein IWZ03DRAFT_409683 [Phyllosticta citriasiana]|uniref:Uncharacterized protein n=1 Tax=Phyllosticta citriasiana TaxID=595635 RepID=A0ABR1K8P0_9PEZI